MENSRDTSCLKTSSELSPPPENATSRQSSRKSSVSKIRKFPRCLCLKRKGGLSQMFSWETDGALRTALLTRNISESLSEDGAYTLSRTLKAKVQEKYYLSPRACRGILRRASARGKMLPEPLRIALERQAESEE